MYSQVPHNRLTDDLVERAALFALGLLAASEEVEFEHHLMAGCDVCLTEVANAREVAAAVGMSAPLIAPPPALRDKVLAAARPSPVHDPGPQVWKSWNASPAAALHVVRQDDGDWETVCPGVHVKKLYVDPARDSITMLIRMDPGARYVPHRHAGPEQCFVLEGDLHEEDYSFQAGDFQCAPEDSTHGAQWTERGCLLLINCSQHDQLIG